MTYFRSYPSYQESEVSVLGPVPEHWKITRLKSCIRQINSGVSVNSIDRPVERDEIGVLKTSCVYSGMFDAKENKLVVSDEVSRVACPVRANALIVSRMNTPNLVGAAGLAKENHPNLFLPDRLWSVEFISDSARFLHYWTCSRTYRAQVEIACEGTSSSMKNLAQEEFLGFYVALPTNDEQEVIANSLDRDISRIDTLIEKKTRFIELLKEKRQAIITYAVIKGLHPDVPRSDAAVEWLGEVPAHWSLVALRNLARPGLKTFTDGDWIETPFITDDGIRLIQTGNIGIGNFKEQGFRFISPDTFASMNCTLVEAGDVLICRLADPVGRACLAPDLGVGMISSVDVTILKPASDVDSRYVVYLLSSTGYLGFMASECRGGTRDRVSRSFLGAVRLPKPPLKEQRIIADWLDARVGLIDRLTAWTERSIELLIERRSALITAAVTGKIDLRKAA